MDMSEQFEPQQRHLGRAQEHRWLDGIDGRRGDVGCAGVGEFDRPRRQHHIAIAVGAEVIEDFGETFAPCGVDARREVAEHAQHRAQLANADPGLVHVFVPAEARRDRAGVAGDLYEAGAHHLSHRGVGRHVPRERRLGCLHQRHLVQALRQHHAALCLRAGVEPQPVTLHPLTGRLDDGDRRPADQFQLGLEYRECAFTRRHGSPVERQLDRPTVHPDLTAFAPDVGGEPFGRGLAGAPQRCREQLTGWRRCVQFGVGGGPGAAAHDDVVLLATEAVAPTGNRRLEGLHPSTALAAYTPPQAGGGEIVRRGVVVRSLQVRAGRTRAASNRGEDGFGAVARYAELELDLVRRSVGHQRTPSVGQSLDIFLPRCDVGANSRHECSPSRTHRSEGVRVRCCATARRAPSGRGCRRTRRPRAARRAWWPRRCGA